MIDNPGDFPFHRETVRKSLKRLNPDLGRSID